MKKIDIVIPCLNEEKISEIEKVELLGDKVGKFDLQNKIRATLKNGENLDIKHLRSLTEIDILLGIALLHICDIN